MTTRDLNVSKDLSNKLDSGELKLDDLQHEVGMSQDWFFPPSAGIKHDDGKPRMELLSWVALREMARVLSFGANKYSDHNWRAGFKWTRLVGAALRHIHKWNDGEDLDEETKLSHLAHAAVEIMFLLEHEIKKLGEDDRWKK